MPNVIQLPSKGQNSEQRRLLTEANRRDGIGRHGKFNGTDELGRKRKAVLVELLVAYTNKLDW